MKVMTVNEVATLMRVSPATIYKMVRSGKLPAFRVGSDYRFDADAIDRWCKAGGVNSDISIKHRPR